MSSSGVPPFDSGDFHNMHLVVDIYEKLGGLRESVGRLKDDTKSNSEKIEQLVQWTIAIPIIEKGVERNAKDLNEFGRRHDKDLHELERRLDKDVNELGKRHDKDLSELKDKDITPLKNFHHTAKTIGVVFLSSLGLLGIILVSLYHHLAHLVPILFPK